MGRWDQLFHSADLLHQEKRFEKQLESQRYQQVLSQAILQQSLNNLQKSYNQLCDKHDNLVDRYNKLLEERRQLQRRLYDMVDEDQRMLPWAREVLTSLRSRFIHNIGKGAPLEKLSLEQRQKINEWILAGAATLYDGLVVAPQTLDKYGPTNQRLSNILGRWKEHEHTQPERAASAKAKLDAEWRDLPESAGEIAGARRRLLSPEVSGEKFRKLLNAQWQRVSAVRAKGVLVPGEGARFRLDPGSANWEGWKSDKCVQVLQENFLAVREQMVD